MRIQLILIIVCFLPLRLVAEEIMRSAETLSAEAKATSVVVKLKEGFHFNDKAPNQVSVHEKVFRPSELKSREVLFVGLPENWSKSLATFYVCDDAVTFCETHHMTLTGPGGEFKKQPTHKDLSDESGKKNNNESAGIATQKSRKGRIDAHGFIEDDLTQALDMAKKKKQLVLIDFAARWCPGCIRLENEVFGTKDFARLTKNYVKLKIDVDRFENLVIAEKFSVKGIPTLLVVNPEQDEIDRVVDFQPLAFLQRFLAAIDSDPVSITALRARAKREDSETSLRLGQRLYWSGKPSESLEYLLKVKPPPALLLAATVDSAGAKHEADANHKSQYIEALQNAIAQEPKSSRSLGWRQRLLELLDDEVQKKKTESEGVSVADQILSGEIKMSEATGTDHVGEFVGAEALLIGMYRAEIVAAAYKKLDAPETIQAWQKAADIGRELKLSTAGKGPRMRYLLVLTRAKSFEEADALAGHLLKDDPGNPEIQWRRLRILNELKKYPQAIMLGESSLKKSFGRNEYWVAEALAKAYIGADRLMDARALLDRYLSRTDAEWSNLQGSKKKMEEMRNSLVASDGAGSKN